MVRFFSRLRVRAGRACLGTFGKSDRIANALWQAIPFYERELAYTEARHARSMIATLGANARGAYGLSFSRVMGLSDGVPTSGH